jgi:hypothetical protein
MDLTSVASEKAAMQGVAEGKSRLSNQFARNLLEGAATGRDAIRSTARIALSDAGDYKLKYSDSLTNGIKIVASGIGSVKGTTSGVWIRPQ